MIPAKVLLFKNYIEKCLDQGEPVDVLYLDFNKAFDTVPHQRLLLKLKSSGVNGKALQFIESFLLDRVQRVKIRDELSDPVEVQLGVPQGSVLGLPFILLTSQMRLKILFYFSLRATLKSS